MNQREKKIGDQDDGSKIEAKVSVLIKFAILFASLLCQVGFCTHLTHTSMEYSILISVIKNNSLISKDNGPSINLGIS